MVSAHSPCSPTFNVKENERLSKQRKHRFLPDNKVAPVLSCFCEGQGHEGTLRAPIELYNSGFAELASAVDACPMEPSIPLTKSDYVPTEEDQTISKRYGVNNVTRVGGQLKTIYEAVKERAQKDQFVINVGGDHSVAGPSIAAMLEKHPDLRVFWIDAHADCNTPSSSPSGNYHGMVLAHLMGWFSEKLPGFEWMKTSIREDRVAYFGLRDIDDFERKKLQCGDMVVYSMKKLDGTNIVNAVHAALNKLDPGNQHPIHISFDVDAADPNVAPGTGTKCSGGLTYRECIRIVEIIQATGRLVSCDVVEINVDQDDTEAPMHGDDPNISSPYKTVKFALHIIRAALGYISC